MKKPINLILMMSNTIFILLSLGALITEPQIDKLMVWSGISYAAIGLIFLAKDFIKANKTSNLTSIAY